MLADGVIRRLNPWVDLRQPRKRRRRKRFASIATRALPAKIKYAHSRRRRRKTDCPTFLSRGLESAGYAVDVAPDGSTAIEMVHATEYDMVIFLDLGLPDVDGLTVLRRYEIERPAPPCSFSGRARLRWTIA